MSFIVGSPLPVQSCINISTVDDDNVEGDQEILVSIVSVSLPNSVSTLIPTQQSAKLLDNDGKICTISGLCNLYTISLSID